MRVHGIGSSLVEIGDFVKDNKKIRIIVVGVFIVIFGLIYFKNYGKDTTKETATLFFDDEKVVEDSLLQEQAISLGENDKETEEQKMVSIDNPTKNEYMFIHVCGAVNQSGVYELAVGSRVIDAVNLAGGFSDDAAVDAINQAQKLTDGLRLYIPTIDDLENANGIKDEYPIITIVPVNDSSSDKGTLETKININTADKKTLMTLPGIGDSKAQSIITYREKNGNFSSIEAIQKISGIKEAVYNKIKEFITVSE